MTIAGEGVTAPDFRLPPGVQVYQLFDDVLLLTDGCADSHSGSGMQCVSEKMHLRVRTCAQEASDCMQQQGC